MVVRLERFSSLLFLGNMIMVTEKFHRHKLQLQATLANGADYDVYRGLHQPPDHSHLRPRHDGRQGLEKKTSDTSRESYS